MNKTKIEWCDSSWNPVTGCLHGCEYCYARGIAQRFGGSTETCPNDGLHELVYPFYADTSGIKDGASRLRPYPWMFDPTLHRYRLDEPQSIEKPRTIFVCSMADIFGEWVPEYWIKAVFDACAAAPQHRYLFLTKNPKRYIELAKMGLLPERENMWYGSTSTTPDDVFWWSNSHNAFVSVEPILAPFNSHPAEQVKVDWIIIGAETGKRKGKVTPKREWIDDLVISAALFGVPVFMKDSLVPIMGEENMLREFPWEREMGK